LKNNSTMKTKLFFLCLITFFTLNSCSDIISVEILSPKDAQYDDKAIYYYYEDINVNIRASAEKGSISQVVLDVDTLIHINLEPPYRYTIPGGTFKKNGFYLLSVTAYSYNGVMAGDAIYLNIEGY